MTNNKKEEWIKKVVENEVYECVSDIVEFILSVTQNSYEYSEDAPFTYDDIEFNDKFNEPEIEELREQIEKIEDEQSEYEEPEQMDDESDEAFNERYDAWDKKNDEFNDRIAELEDRISDLEDEQSEMPDVFEWYAVSDWLANSLYELGEVVIRGWHNYWGRGCSGQAVYMDGVMSRLYDMYNGE